MVVVVADAALEVVVDTGAIVELESPDSELQAVATSATTSAVRRMDWNRVTATYRSGSPILNSPRLKAWILRLLTVDR